MRLFGHPIHPMLVHFPIALWTVAAGAYVASAADVTAPVAMIAKFANGGGLIMAMLAIFFLVALLLSISTGLDHSTAQIAAAVCAVAGFLLMGVGGWYGGRLVYEHGVAVNASNLTGRE